MFVGRFCTVQRAFVQNISSYLINVDRSSSSNWLDNNLEGTKSINSPWQSGALGHGYPYIECTPDPGAQRGNNELLSMYGVKGKCAFDGAEDTSPVVQGSNWRRVDRNHAKSLLFQRLCRYPGCTARVRTIALT